LLLDEEQIMKAIEKIWIAAAVLSTAMAASTSSAAEIGWLDSVQASQVDNAYGWVCMNEDAYNTPSYGSLDVYVNGPVGSADGFFYGNYSLSQGTWGYEKDGVNEAGYCGTDTNVGFRLSGWFVDYDHPGPTTLYVYWHDTSGNLTLLGGSPATDSSPGAPPGGGSNQ
jgi:hypothetical protein